MARPYGLTPVALQTLISVLLAGKGPLSLSGLGDELRVTKANVSLVLAGLEKQKLIRRHADPSDGRKIRATVTDSGKRLLAEIIPLAAGAMKERLSALSADDRSTLQRLAREVRRSLGNESVDQQSGTIKVIDCRTVFVDHPVAAVRRVDHDPFQVAAERIDRQRISQRINGKLVDLIVVRVKHEVG